MTGHMVCYLGSPHFHHASFSNGTFIGMTLIPEQYTIGFFTGAPGGFFVFAIFIAVTRLIRVAYEKNKGEQK